MGLTEINEKVFDSIAYVKVGVVTATHMLVPVNGVICVMQVVSLLHVIVVEVYTDVRFYGAGHYVYVKTVIFSFTRLTTLVEAGVFNENDTVRGVVKNAEVVDVRGPEELIVPDVEDAVCMFKQLSF